MPSKKPTKKGTKTDIVIPVMGPTGAGKSTFINALLREKRMEVGYKLSSCTSELGFGFIETIPGYPKLESHRIVIVDTPGFDDTYKGDSEILKSIAEWLDKSYRNGAVLGGVIYLHDVTSDRFTGTARRNLEMFQHLCGQEALSKVVIGTTKWGRIDSKLAEQHQAELQDVHWKPILAKGSQVLRFKDTYESAWGFIDAILRKNEEKPSKAPKKSLLESRDIVILVTGLSGAGKSTFINALLGNKRMAVGLGMTSGTTKIDYEIIDPIPNHPSLKGRRLIIVDTPGFNNASIADTNILRQIVEWLELRCKDGTTLGGVVYLHEICSDRFSSLTMRDLAILRASFAGSAAIQKVVLATTKWGRVTAEEGKSREKELTEGSFRSLTRSDIGSKLHRFDGTFESSWNIVKVILDHIVDEPGIDIRPHLAKLQGHLKNNSGDRAAKDLFSSLRSLFSIFGRVSNKSS